MASHSSTGQADKPASDTQSTAIQKEFYVDVLESLIKSFPGPQEDAIGKAIKYLQDVDDRSRVDASINQDGRNSTSRSLSSPTQENFVINEKNSFGRGSAEVELSQAKKSYS